MPQDNAATALSQRVAIPKNPSGSQQKLGVFSALSLTKESFLLINKSWEAFLTVLTLFFFSNLISLYAKDFFVKILPDHFFQAALITILMLFCLFLFYILLCSTFIAIHRLNTSNRFDFFDLFDSLSERKLDFLKLLLGYLTLSFIVLITPNAFLVDLFVRLNDINFSLGEIYYTVIMTFLMFCFLLSTPMVLIQEIPPFESIGLSILSILRNLPTWLMLGALYVGLSRLMSPYTFLCDAFLIYFFYCYHQKSINKKA